MAVDIAKYPLLFVPGLPRVTDLVQRALKLVQPDTPEAGNLLARYGLLLNLVPALRPRGSPGPFPAGSSPPESPFNGL